MNYTVNRVWMDSAGYLYREDVPGFYRRTTAPKTTASLHPLGTEHARRWLQLFNAGQLIIVEEPW